MFLNVPRPDKYGELATWIWLSIVPFHDRCDVCDVTLPLTPSLPYVTRRHNNVNPLPPPSVTSFMDDPLQQDRAPMPERAPMSQRFILRWIIEPANVKSSLAYEPINGSRQPDPTPLTASAFKGLVLWFSVHSQYQFALMMIATRRTIIVNQFSK